MRSEAEVLQEVKEWLDMEDVFYWRESNAPVIRGNVSKGTAALSGSSNLGIPDLIGVIPFTGRMFMLEVKKQGWEPPKEPADYAPGSSLGQGVSAAKLREWAHYCRQKHWITRCIANGGVGAFVTSLEEAMEALDHHIPTNAEKVAHD